MFWNAVFREYIFTRVSFVLCIKYCVLYFAVNTDSRKCVLPTRDTMRLFFAYYHIFYYYIYGVFFSFTSIFILLLLFSILSIDTCSLLLHRVFIRAPIVRIFLFIFLLTSCCPFVSFFFSDLFISSCPVCFRPARDSVI